MMFAFTLSILALFVLSGPVTVKAHEEDAHENLRGLTGTCAGKEDGSPCNDDNKCLKDGQCDEGVCYGRIKVCNPPTQCKVVVGECDPTTGFCTYAHKPNGTPCDDGNDATLDDVCIDGFCNPCTGFCCGMPDGTLCNNGNKCFKNAVCESQVCTGNYKICNPPTQCKVVIGECNPATGFCTFEKKPNGAECNDGNRATTYDICVDGFCVGYAKPPVG